MWQNSHLQVFCTFSTVSHFSSAALSPYVVWLVEVSEAPFGQLLRVRQVLPVAAGADGAHLATVAA